MFAIISWFRIYHHFNSVICQKKDIWSQIPNVQYKNNFTAVFKRSRPWPLLSLMNCICCKRYTELRTATCNLLHLVQAPEPEPEPVTSGTGPCTRTCYQNLYQNQITCYIWYRHLDQNQNLLHLVQAPELEPEPVTSGTGPCTREPVNQNLLPLV